jgi:sugar fermentation stimulation protein A
MIYENIRHAVFLNRPNRFIANIEIDGKVEVCHVKNTGRCLELLTKGAELLVQENSSPARKTRFDIISVYKGSRLINMDSQAPNKVFMEWVKDSGLFNNITQLKPEYSFGTSRFDFYIEADGRKSLVEVKGVTLEENGVVRFPDAPTQRGVKHLNELTESVRMGYDAYIVFIIQMKNVKYIEPNWGTHPEFGYALRRAAEQGVKIIALDCIIGENSIKVAD